MTENGAATPPVAMLPVDEPLALIEELQALIQQSLAAAWAGRSSQDVASLAPILAADAVAAIRPALHAAEHVVDRERHRAKRFCRQLGSSRRKATRATSHAVDLASRLAAAQRERDELTAFVCAIRDTLGLVDLRSATGRVLMSDTLNGARNILATLVTTRSLVDRLREFVRQREFLLVDTSRAALLAEVRGILDGA